jgi:tRNA-modifying protein YgfZ
MQTNCRIPLVDLGLIQITGKNAAQFLQGQLTCDVSEVNTQQSRLGAHCDVKGRIQATFRLLFYQDAYYFLLPRCMLAHLLQCLRKYAVFSAVTLIDVTEHWQKIGLVGPSISSLLNKSVSFPEQNNGVISSKTLISLRMPGAIPRFILLSADKQLLSCVDHALQEKPINDWYLFDIMAGIATVYPQTSALFTPQQLNYPAIGGVSFTKGCYIGQEIIARTHYLGKPKSCLYRASFQSNDNIPSGTSLQNEENIQQGTLIMSAKEKAHHYQALICLQTAATAHTIHLGNTQGPVLQHVE